MDRLDSRAVGAVIDFVYGALAEAPARVGRSLHGPFEGSFSARRGPYRIVYRCDDTAVVIERVAHNSAAYRL